MNAGSPEPSSTANVGPAHSTLGGGLVAPVTLISLLIWGFLANYMGVFTWGHGPSTFLMLVLLVCLLMVLRVASLHPAKAVTPPPWQRQMTRLVLTVALCLACGWTAFGLVRGFMKHPDWMIDIAANTHKASELLSAMRNPYASRAQLWYDIQPGPHVEISGGDVKMYGVPYYYGYPYFPATFLTYMPLYLLIEGYASIRTGNLLLLALNILGLILLVWRFSGVDRRIETAMIAVVSYLGVYVYAREIFDSGIVDILISTYALFAFVALAYGRDWTAGLLLGAAQACKLLPGPFLILAVVLALSSGTRRLRVMAGYLVAASLIIGPFFVMNPGAFVSSTVLYYLTNHATGDNTSLWYFLPELIQGSFLLAGPLLAGAVLVVLSRLGREPTLGAILASFCSFAVFMAFSQMTHLNYMWGVYPLGCLALAILSEKSMPTRVEKAVVSLPNKSHAADPEYPASDLRR
jgi:hypothetical protein